MSWRAAWLPCWLMLGACDASSGPRASLVFVGDITLDGRPGALIAAGSDPFAAMAKELQRADVAIGNLECAVATGGQAVDKMFTFRAAPLVLPTLKQHLDAVSLANNHSGDFGPEGLVETLQGLRAEGIPAFGAGLDASEAHRALVVEPQGLRVALLGYDEFHPRWFEASERAPGVAWSEDEFAELDIARARDAGAALVIPFLHWGWENEVTPTARQRSLARRLIDAGAAAVIGAHPHVTQGAEYYRGRPIIYSLGNFLFELQDNANQSIGWLLRLKLDTRGVERWSTLVVRLNADGVPFPDAAASSPCGTRRGGRIESCRGGQWGSSL